MFKGMKPDDPRQASLVALQTASEQHLKVLKHCRLGPPGLALPLPKWCEAASDRFPQYASIFALWEDVTRMTVPL